MAEKYKGRVTKWERVPLCYPAVLRETPAHQGISGGNDERRKTILEIGPGRGDFLFFLAEKNPNAKIIGVELKSKRFFKLVERITKRKLENVQIIQADGRHAVAELFTEKSIDEIHVNFPDPWPKKRHAKNRLLKEEFLRDCVRILKKDGILSIITDSKNYSEEIIENASKVIKGFHLRPETDETPYPTFFAEKWQKEGRKFFWLKWEKPV